MGRLDGKVAIVTGGARGIGAAICRAFVGEGARVAIADILTDEAETLARDLGPAAHAYTHDVTSAGGWAALEADVSARFGPIDVLVNNAGVLLFRGLFDTSEADFDRVLAINLKGAFLGIKAMGAGMAERGRGSIINLSSVEGLRGTNGAAAYASSKWALRGLTRVAALELGHRGVRVNSVHPGGIDTVMGNPQGLPPQALDPVFAKVPAQRIGQPREIASAVVFLASDDASYVMGAELLADGGMSAGTYYPALPGAPG